MLKQSLKKRWERLKFALYPEPLVLSSKWADSWIQQQKISFRTMAVISSSTTFLLFVSHYYFHDIPAGIGPRDLLITYRFGNAAICLTVLILALNKKFMNSKFNKIPLFIMCAVIVWCQSRVYIWWPQLEISVEYILIFVVGSVFVLSTNLLWSFILVTFFFAINAPSHFEAQFDPNRLLSNFLVGMTFAYFLRNGHKSDIQSYVLREREKEETKKRNEAEQSALKAQQELLANELELTGAVQKLLMPKSNECRDPKGRFHLFGHYQSAEHCGGDWWWYHTVNNKLQVIVGDVTGHGAGPAMVTATLSSFMKVLYDENKSLPNLLNELSNHFRDYFKDSPYMMTLSAMQVDLESHLIETWFAGAPPIYFMDKQGKVTALSEKGAQLGSPIQKIGYESREFSAGGRLILLTDGLQEAHHEKQNCEIGTSRLLRIIKKSKDVSVEAAVKDTINQVETLRGAHVQDDDYTCVMVDLPQKGLFLKPDEPSKNHSPKPDPGLTL